MDKQVSREKYKEFMNYMRNDLQITKEDIQSWTEDSVSLEVSKYFNSPQGLKQVDSIIKQEVRETLNGCYGNATKMRENIAIQIAKRLTVAVKSAEVDS